MRVMGMAAAILTLATEASLGAAVASPEAAESTASPEAQRGWVLRDHCTDEVLAQSDSDFTAEGVQVVQRTADPGEVFFNVQHSLVDDFVAGASVYPLDGPDDRTGFGLWLRRENHPTFSWDWFNVTGKGRAEKIQGGGAVTFEVGNVDGRLQMTSIHVVEDIVLRCTDDMNQAANTVNDPNGVPYRWSCTIRAGTDIPLRR